MTKINGAYVFGVIIIIVILFLIFYNKKPPSNGVSKNTGPKVASQKEFNLMHTFGTGGKRKRKPRRKQRLR